ncbi:MAG: hypothetical protein IPI79_00135 [Moraxellaceae bacterium]|nr:hypothetical protein [Moraxellaceae bacterium]
MITAFDGQAIELSSELPQLIGRAKVGKISLYHCCAMVKSRIPFEVVTLPDDADENPEKGQ